jgi:NAD+ kinase
MQDQLGGDGTLLYASWLFQNIVPPVLSFSLGSLGFLTKFDYFGFRETLATAFRDGVTVSLRSRFEGTVMRSRRESHNHNNHDLVEELVGDEAENELTHKPFAKYEILNDIGIEFDAQTIRLLTAGSSCGSWTKPKYVDVCTGITRDGLTEV